ncbi:MAG: ATP-dependent helicase [Pseudomonadota bacterium]
MASEHLGVEPPRVGERHPRRRDVAGLVRVRDVDGGQARAVELALREVNIPYETFGGSSFFERKEVKDFLGYIRLLARPDDRLAFYRVINTPNRGIGLKSLEKIEECATKSQTSPWRVAKDSATSLGLTGKSLSSLQQFVSDFDSLRSWTVSTAEDLAKLGHEIIKRFQLTRDIRDHVKDAASVERKIDALKSLPRWLASAAQDVLKERGHLDIHELLDRLTLNDRDFSDRDENGKPNRVSLMTMHASKGLEFPAVIVCGMEEDLFPHKNSASNSNGLMEERRLFYVALTRAKKRSVLTWAAERGSGTMKTSRLPSRFLSELPAGAISANQQLANTATRIEEKKEKTLSALQSLRANLKPQPRV